MAHVRPRPSLGWYRRSIWVSVAVMLGSFCPTSNSPFPIPAWLTSLTGTLLGTAQNAPSTAKNTKNPKRDHWTTVHGTTDREIRERGERLVMRSLRLNPFRVFRSLR